MSQDLNDCVILPPAQADVLRGGTALSRACQKPEAKPEKETSK